MKKLLVYMASVFFLFSCASKEVKIPDGIIPRDKMVDILTEVQITEAVMTYKDSRGDVTLPKAPEYYQFIFTKYQTTEKQFRESFAFYTSQVEMMDKIYEDVIIEISKRQAEVPNK